MKISIVCTYACGTKNNETIQSTKKLFISVLHMSQNSCANGEEKNEIVGCGRYSLKMLQYVSVGKERN